MSIENPTDADRNFVKQARHFVTDMVEPLAEQIDREQVTPPSLMRALHEHGWLGAALPTKWGGGGADPASYGRAIEEFGAVCSSTRTLLTVHNMSTQAIVRFGGAELQERWLPDLCSGRKIIAFALTEPQAGSDVSALQTTATLSGAEYCVTGTKIWCSYGCAADMYLVFVVSEGKPVALLVEAGSEGLTVEPMPDAFGTRGSMIARLNFEAVPVPASNRVGAVGAGINLVANTALDHGRFSVAWGSVGLIRACLDACLDYASVRHQGGALLSQHQLVRRHLTDLLLAYTTAQSVCLRSAALRSQGDPRAAAETALAKYHASEAALRAAQEAVALHGANGCSPNFPVSRYLRDATVAAIIEGTKEAHQVALASYALQRPWRND